MDDKIVKQIYKLIFSIGFAADFWCDLCSVNSSDEKKFFTFRREALIEYRSVQ